MAHHSFPDRRKREDNHRRLRSGLLWGSAILSILIDLAAAVAAGSSLVLVGGIMARVDSEGAGGVLPAAGGFLMFVGGALTLGVWTERKSPKTADAEMSLPNVVRAEQEAV